MCISKLFIPERFIKGHVMVAFFLLVLIPLLRIHIIPFYSIRIYLILVILVIYLISILTGSLIRGDKLSFSISPLDIIFILYCFFYFLSYILSVNKEVSFIALLQEFPFILLYIFFRFLLGSRESINRSREYLSVFVIFTVIILSLWGLSQYFFEFDVSRGLKSLFKTHHFPVIASLGNPNFLAEFLVLSAPMTMTLLSSKKRYSIFITVFILMGLALFFTYSRLAWAVMLIFMITSMVLSPEAIRKRLIIPFVLLVFICSSFFVYHCMTDSTKSMRIITSLNNVRENLLTEREIMYKAGFEMLKDSSLSGMGPGAFGFNYLNYQGMVVRDHKIVPLKHHLIDLDHAHSDFLEIGIDSGYIALIIFIVLALYSALKGTRNILVGDDEYRYINMIPILYIPFGLMAFPFYLPFSKMLFLLSLANISGMGKRYEMTVRFTMLFPILSILLLLSFTYFHSRYISSIIHHKRGMKHYTENIDVAFNEFCKGIRSFPYNGYNYFSAGALLLNQPNISGIIYLKQSLNYMNNTYAYLYLARGYRDLGMIRNSKIWYKRLLAIRPDLVNARREYQEILDIEGEE